MKISLALLAVMAVLVISTAAESTKQPEKGASKPAAQPTGTKPAEKAKGAEKPTGTTPKKAASQSGRRSTSKGETRSRPTGTGTRQTPKRAKAFY